MSYPSGRDSIITVELHLGIVSLFTVTKMMFTFSVINFDHNDITNLKNALFFFFLLIDLSKTTTLAQYALSSRNQEEVKANIARGMSLLGPAITMDTLVRTLLISTGSLSGIRRLETLCTFACLGMIVNYVVFMTFYPACLSLILELSRENINMVQLSVDRSIRQPFNEENQTPNPIVEQIKKIMIVGLLVVHANSRWFFKNEDEYTKMATTCSNSNATSDSDHIENSELEKYLMTWLSTNADKIIVLILVLAVAVKFIFFDDRNDVVARQLRLYDYNMVLGACCKNVIGYMPVPIGIVGPLLIDGQLYHVPIATTEGCLIASTNRGSRALLKYGVTTRVTADGMTREPVVQFPDIVRACEAILWIEQPQNFQELKNSFDQTSHFASLKKIYSRISGRDLHLCFVATTGDAMGTNMLLQGTEKSLQTLQTYFPDMEIISLSGNLCTDKKPATVNWIEGRGKSVVCEAIIPADLVARVLKTSVPELIKLNNKRNLIGSALTGSIGGFNAHAASIVTAIFIATGQDPAQNIGSSNCLTLMESWGVDLHMTCTMPSIEIGTIGGDTVLPAHRACLRMLGIKGRHPIEPGQNAQKFARIVCATVLAGELSLMAELASEDLIKSHLRHNRHVSDVMN
ncbi:3-hydroxy-3-methylglutaryl-coenzyme A reductase [Solenopsis invicta]|uniref:3-hydroxy-3-methylglutaryl-coenzyme A reductase n=1 Tax=Solenopsis invicta TaxID=13686 RepID=UPI00193DD806|nr:3-hydroxy-3-methylglutaryl-coenzyme A reductase [Solenopsis invicta]